MQYDVSQKNTLKRLNKMNESGKFRKYPDFLLSKTCVVKVNDDDFLVPDEFIISCNFPILPRNILLYGKKHKSNENDTNNIYLNYWLEVFLKTIEQGNICNMKLKKNISNNELTIGLPLIFRRNAFNWHNWSKDNIIKFLSCLFGVEIEEAYFYQQSLLDYIAA